MRNDYSRYIEEIASAIYHLFTEDPCLSARAIKSEVSDYYGCIDSDYKKADKIAERWDRLGRN